MTAPTKILIATMALATAGTTWLGMHGVGLSKPDNTPLSVREDSTRRGAVHGHRSRGIHGGGIHRGK